MASYFLSQTFKTSRGSLEKVEQGLGQQDRHPGQHPRPEDRLRQASGRLVRVVARRRVLLPTGGRSLQAKV